MTRVAIVAARRTPFGRFGGGLADRSPVELASAAGEAALEGLDRSAIDLVILGNVLAAGHGMNLARQVSVGLGLPIETPAYSINMMCGSGLHAAALGVQAIRAGEARVALVGGVDSMSQAALLVRRPPKGQPPTLDAVTDSLQRDGLVDSFSHRPMGATVEDLARELQISRNQQDAFAARSQERFAAAQIAGRFTEELVPVAGLSADEHPRPDVTTEALGQLRPLFAADGTITAGNSSGVNDGAAVLVLAELEWAQARSWPVLAEWRDSVAVGCDPQRMGLGPVHALGRLLDRAGHSWGVIDTLEINEAFAAQTLACLRRLDLRPDDARLAFNPDGGAIAVGHPLAASGARLLVHLAWRVARGESRRAAAALCVGGGMGVAALLESVPSRVPR